MECCKRLRAGLCNVRWRSAIATPPRSLRSPPCSIRQLFVVALATIRTEPQGASGAGPKHYPNNVSRRRRHASQPLGSVESVTIWILQSSTLLYFLDTFVLHPAARCTTATAPGRVSTRDRFSSVYFLSLRLNISSFPSSTPPPSGECRQETTPDLFSGSNYDHLHTRPHPTSQRDGFWDTRVRHAAARQPLCPERLAGTV